MDNILFTIYGFNIRPNTLYEVTSKLDSSAPDGWKEFKTSKLPHPDIKDGYPGAIFDMGMGIWDTGLYENSKALIKAIPSSDERTKFIKDVKKHLVDPLQKLKGKEYLSPANTKENNEFWDNYRVSLYKDKIFNTEKLEDLLQLFLVVLHQQVTPQPLESHPDFKNSQFCIIDKEDSVDRTQEAEYGKMQAQGIFMNLLESKPKDLLLILDYLRLNVSANTDKKVLVSLFNNWLKDKTDGYQNYSVFLKTHKMFLTDEGEREIFLYSKMKELSRKKNSAITTKKNDVYFEDEFIGADFKSATKAVLADKDLQSRFLKYTEPTE